MFAYTRVSSHICLIMVTVLGIILSTKHLVSYPVHGFWCRVLFIDTGAHFPHCLRRLLYCFCFQVIFTTSSTDWSINIGVIIHIFKSPKCRKQILYCTISLHRQSTLCQMATHPTLVSVHYTHGGSKLEASMNKYTAFASSQIPAVLLFALFWMQMGCQLINLLVNTDTWRHLKFPALTQTHILCNHTPSSRSNALCLLIQVTSLYAHSDFPLLWN